MSHIFLTFYAQFHFEILKKKGIYQAFRFFSYCTPHIKHSVIKNVSHESYLFFVLLLGVYINFKRCNPHHISALLFWRPFLNVTKWDFVFDSDQESNIFCLFMTENKVSKFSYLKFLQNTIFNKIILTCSLTSYCSTSPFSFWAKLDKFT